MELAQSMGGNRESVRAALPKEALELWNDIEKFAGVSIAVELHAKIPSPAAVAITHEAVVIYVRDFAKITPQIITHELLHIERFWIEGVPQFAAAIDTQNARDICADIDNGLEHLVIVPREQKYGFSDSPLFADIQLCWKQFPWNNIPVESDKISYALRESLALRLVHDPSVIHTARSCLKVMGILDKADRFASDIDQRLDDKSAVAACAKHYLKIPRHAVCLRYLDVRSRTFWCEAIPDFA